jgi:LPS-assembly protein
VTDVTALQGCRLERRRSMALRRVFSLGLMSALIATPLLLAGIAATPAAAQGYTYNPRPPAPPPRRPVGSDGQMLVNAKEVNYDYTNSRVAAVGEVQIYYNNSTVEADKVIYDQKTKRLHAEGNVRLTDGEGRVTHAEILDLSDDYRDGFIDSLRLDTPDQTRMAAARADRTDGNFTVFSSSVYTACAECKNDPKKPPLWQVKAARIIHDEGEKMLYFENAQLEFFGVPMAYLPYFSTPDPTVKRKSGFLMPWAFSSSKYGTGFEVPYYWALAPDYDLTITPRYTSKQGVLLQGEWRQRLLSGAYEIRAYGIRQQDKDYFLRSGGPATPGYRDNRGGVETSGQFAINNKWIWGWDAVLLSDKTFLQDYQLGSFRKPLNVFTNSSTEGISQLYLSGIGNRSYFDVRSIYYLGYSEADVQRQIPVIHPVLDYRYVFDRPILGGEVGYKVNFTSLSREAANFDPISAAAYASGICTNTANPAAILPGACLLRGAPGTYSRLSAEVQWRRSITDPLGQIWTPFAKLRTDFAVASINSQSGVSNFITPGNTEMARVMPTVGVEYRYPFIAAQPWGSQTIEPIAQVIVRPNEGYAGLLPNEDAQSLTFDDSNLFRVDKFSGWDRAEGGGRANVGIQATTQFDSGGSLNVLVGQSYQLFGANSFAIGDLTNTGVDSGLENRRSDYIGRVSYQPNRTFMYTTRVRVDEADLSVKRFELETRANFDRWNISLLYGNYDKQPTQGFLARRQGVLGTVTAKIATNWVVTAGARYDIDFGALNQTIIGAGYVDDCFLLGVNYVTDYAYSGNPKADHRLMLQIGLRTIGGTSISQNVGNSVGTTP